MKLFEIRSWIRPIIEFFFSFGDFITMKMKYDVWKCRTDSLCVNGYDYFETYRLLWLDRNPLTFFFLLSFESVWSTRIRAGDHFSVLSHAILWLRIKPLAKSYLSFLFNRKISTHMVSVTFFISKTRKWNIVAVRLQGLCIHDKKTISLEILIRYECSFMQIGLFQRLTIDKYYLMKHREYFSL